MKINRPHETLWCIVKQSRLFYTSVWFKRSRSIITLFCVMLFSVTAGEVYSYRAHIHTLGVYRVSMFS